MRVALIVQLLYLSTFVACAFAAWKGGMAERLGSVVVLGAALGPPALHAVAPADLAALVDLTADGVVGVAFLLLTVRYGRVWLGATMLLFAVQFALHAFYAVTDRPSDLLHARINNLVFLGVSVCLCAGAALAWRRRRLAGRRT